MWSDCCNKLWNVEANAHQIREVLKMWSDCCNSPESWDPALLLFHTIAEGFEMRWRLQIRGHSAISS
jgi:hypothetical protein